MKIAGQKNPGAWHRFNKALKKIRIDSETTDEVYEWSSSFVVEHGALVVSVFEAFGDLAAKAGVTTPSSPSSGAALMARYAGNGVPLQIWMGRLSFDTYTLSGDEGDRVATADHQAVFHDFGKAIRKHSVKWIKARRAIKDLTDTGLAGQGNPGGQPDGTPGN